MRPTDGEGPVRRPRLLLRAVVAGDPRLRPRRGRRGAPARRGPRRSDRRPSRSWPASPSSCAATASSWTRRSWCSTPAGRPEPHAPRAPARAGDGRGGSCRASSALPDLLYLDGASLAGAPVRRAARRARGADGAVRRGASPGAASSATARPSPRPSGRSASGPSRRAGSTRRSEPGPPATPGTACPSSRRRASCRHSWPSSAGSHCKRRRTDESRDRPRCRWSAIARSATSAARPSPAPGAESGRGPGRAVSRHAPIARRLRPVRRPSASREPPPLRPAPRDRRRPRLVGAPEGPDARPRRAALRRPDRGPPDRVPRLRGGHPEGRVRRGRLDLLGLGHVRARADVGPGRGRPGGRAEAPAARPEAGRAVHAGPDRRRRRRSGAGRPARAPRSGGRVGEDDGDAWLLIAKAGPEAIPGWDPEAHPASVKTGRTNEEVAAGVEPRADHPAPAPLPTLDPPGLAAARPARLRRADAGDAGDRPVRRRRLALRAEVGRLPGPGDRGRREGRAPDAQPARRRPLLPGAARPADLAGGAGGDRRRRGRRPRRRRAARLRPPPGAPRRRLLVVGPARQPRRRRRPGRGAPLVFMAFDLPWCAGRSYLDVPLEERKEILRLVLRDHPRVRYGGHVARDGVAFYAAAAAQGLEGAMAKHRRSRYEAGPPLDGVAEAEGAAHAGAGRRRLRAGPGEPPRPRARSSSA